jgi:hypothetical protein
MRRLTTYSLVLFALVGAGLWFVPDCVEVPVEVAFGWKLGPEEIDAWLAEHGAAAESLARRMLATDGSVAIPSDLEPADPRRRGDAVLFTLRRGDYEEPDQGLAFAPSGRCPRPLEPGQESRWRPVRGPWWLWTWEFF